jgi:hypothetical protein
MLYWQGALHQVINPESLFCSLTFRAMPIAAAIVTVTNPTAVFARLFVPAQGSRAASSYFAQHPVLQRGKLCICNQAGTE